MPQLNGRIREGRDLVRDLGSEAVCRIIRSGKGGKRDRDYLLSDLGSEVTSRGCLVGEKV